MAISVGQLNFGKFDVMVTERRNGMYQPSTVLTVGLNATRADRIGGFRVPTLSPDR
jgi:hypothetical protein